MTPERLAEWINEKNPDYLCIATYRIIRLAPLLLELWRVMDEVGAELIEELRNYARPSWDWKYGEDWNTETKRVTDALAALREAE